MKILLIGEASFLHNTLKKGLLERGHRVTTMSDGNGWHDAPRDIDLRRDGRWGKLGGLRVVWQLLRHLPHGCGRLPINCHPTRKPCSLPQRPSRRRSMTRGAPRHPLPSILDLMHCPRPKSPIFRVL